MAFRDTSGRRAPATEPDWLTLGQAAKYLGVAQSTIRKWSDQGRVPAFYTPGGHRRYRRSDVYRKLVALDRRNGYTARLAKLRGQPAEEYVVQDVEIPIGLTAKFLDVFHRDVGIKPVWL